jgi:twitching motility protein PilI
VSEVEAMARAGKIDLRTFQQELAARLASKTAAQVESSRLGLACAGEQWLIRLSDAGEVIAVPPVATVPMTKPWFLGIANIRGNLYTVIDFAGFLGRYTTQPGSTGRLVLFGPRAGELRAGIVVTRVLGLRNLAELAPTAPLDSAPAWYAQRWMDAQGGSWQEIDLAKLAQDAEFLQVGR